MTYSSPSRTASVRIAWTSEPAWGSVIEYAARSSPVAIRGRYLRRCSSVPYCWIIHADRKCVLSTPESDIQPRESSIWISAYVVKSSPRPPCSSGMITPKRPSSFICSTSSSG
jgi:hypothetical protein